MPENLGGRLRQQREGQGIALATIAEQTKIKLSLLEALERDDVSQWPSGIFRRAFIRAYAHAIGLEPDVVVREFLEVHPDPDEEVAAVAAMAARNDDGRPGGPPIRLRYLVGSALGSLSRLRRGAADDQPAVESPRLAAPVPYDLTAAIATVEVPRAIGVDPIVAPPPAQEPPAVERPNEPPVVAAPIPDRAPFDPDLPALADLCTALGRVANPADVQPLLEEASRILDATGVIVWVWDDIASELRPALAHGYTDRVLAQLPPVTRDADNATAAAFRSGQTYVIAGNDRSSGALAIPLLTPAGSAGVLAIELPEGREQMTSARAVATVVAAMLAQLAGAPAPAQAQPPVQTTESSLVEFVPVRRVHGRR